MSDLMDAHVRKIFFEVYDNLPRGGPGDALSTGRALAMASFLPDQPKILDIGCGPGMQTIDLARTLPKAKIWAVDNHEPFIHRLALKAQAFQGRLIAQIGDMRQLEFPEAFFDLIWSEGAIYQMGFENGLKSWNPLLKNGGYMAVSEMVWLKKNPSYEVQLFWKGEYPEMSDVSTRLENIRENGFEPCGYFTLSESAWYDNYYHPLMKRVAELKCKYRMDAEALDILHELEQEEKIIGRNLETCNYAFFVCRKTTINM
ncbi:MAG: class I SAM-dependent methyltransferase [candidate division FCPU426 bacterium]